MLKLDRLVSCAGFRGSKTFTTLLELILLATLFNLKYNAVHATYSTPETTGTDNVDRSSSSNGGNTFEKRNWKSLQGGWGKRSLQLAADPAGPFSDEYFWTEHVVPMMTSSGEVIYLTNLAALERLMNNNQQRSFEDMGNARANSDMVVSLEDTETQEDISNEKRNWKSMNAAWGKRRNAPTWNKFRGAWGKREPGWNNLKGMWGKRSSDWQKLHGGWGKRAQNNFVGTN